MDENAACSACIFAGKTVTTDEATCTFALQCRRHAPLVTGGMMSSVETVWPVVQFFDWCGEFKFCPKQD